MATMLRLYIGRHDTRIVIRPDGLYPAMWRVILAGDQLGAMASLTRTKAAALRLARPRGLGRSVAR